MDNNYLIVNLKRFGDIYSSIHLVDSIMRENPQAKISVLVYKEFSKVIKTVHNISKCYEIDREKIISLFNNPIYSDAYALNELKKVTNLLEAKRWKKVINYSNDRVGTYICSIVKSENNCGVKFSKNHIPEHSNEWSIIFNDMLTSYKHTPIHFVDCYHKLLGIDRAIDSSHKLITNETHNLNAFNSFNEIRKNESKEGIDLKMVGIQLKASKESKEVPLDTIVETLNLILDDPGLFPILLIAPTIEERTYVNKINEYFDNKLITVEADFIALSSVLLNLDIIITPDTVIKHMADLLSVPVLEISLGQAPFLKQGTIQKGCLVLTPIVDSRMWFTNQQVELPNLIKGSDIYNSLQIYFNPGTENVAELSENVTLYRTSYDDNGICYLPIAGELNLDTEIIRYLSRYVTLSIMGENSLLTLKNIIMQFPHDFIKKIIAREKEQIISTTRKLLNTLRSLMSTKDNQGLAKDFVQHLNALFEECEESHLGTLSILIFRAQIESLSNGGLSKNISDVEKLLFQTKTNIQKTINILETFDSEIDEINIQNITRKNTEVETIN